MTDIPKIEIKFFVKIQIKAHILHCTEWTKSIFSFLQGKTNFKLNSSSNTTLSLRFKNISFSQKLTATCDKRQITNLFYPV